MKDLRSIFGIVLLVTAFTAGAQHRDQAQEYINTLASDQFFGRGYINQGERIAADYIRNEFRKMGLDSLNTEDGYFDPFTLNVNTIEHCELEIDGKAMRPGYDFFVSPGMESMTIEKEIFVVSDEYMSRKFSVNRLRKVVMKGKLPVFMPLKSKKSLRNYIRFIAKTRPEYHIRIAESFVWSVHTGAQSYNEIVLLDSSFNKNARTLKIKVNARYVNSYKTQNVIGIVPGTENPEEFIVLCGHYDHLGMMGTAIFNGANDNASGIAMILDLASYFMEHPQKYSIMIIAFGAEEAGLLGSKHFVYSPPEGIILDHIRFVFNLDLMGSGEDGATIVNGRVYTDEFDRLLKINARNNYLSQVKARGEAANSDHYFFSKEGVASFFIYTMGGYTYYHVPEDNPANLKLSATYDRSFLLIRDFIIELNTLN